MIDDELIDVLNPPPEPGKQNFWCRLSWDKWNEKPDTQNLAKKIAAGWEIRPPDTLPDDYRMNTENWYHPDYGEGVAFGGLLLMWRPVQKYSPLKGGKNYWFQEVQIETELSHENSKVDIWMRTHYGDQWEQNKHLYGEKVGLDIVDDPERVVRDGDEPPPLSDEEKETINKWTSEIQAFNKKLHKYPK